MSDFSAEWLALREPVDHRSLAPAVAAEAIRRLANVDNPLILDLGCGGGSGLRALAPKLGPQQRWRLVDHDASLIAAAREMISRWADRVDATSEPGLRVEKDGRHLAVDFDVADLREGVAPLLEDSPDLVTAAAFFDLAGGAWITNFAQNLISRNIPLYATLIYDGRESWSPPHAADAAMLAAFHAHQARDKGLGPAAGPNAGDTLRNVFAAAGWRVVVGDSAWRLDASDNTLIAALAAGSAEAVAQTGLAPAATIAEWRAARIAASACAIGHVDIFAAPDF